MKSKKIILAGGTGFIGQYISNYFGDDNEIVILSRNKPDEKTNAFEQQTIHAKNVRTVFWNAKDGGAWENEINGADLLINLAGKTVNCRYTPKNKQAIFDSRTESTSALGRAIQNCTAPPKCWINASSATIYPHTMEAPFDETCTTFADDFSVQVCKRWEKTFFDCRTPFTRKIALRMSVTLGAGGVMIPYFNLLKFGLGGRQGSGKQYYSWIHITDTCRMIDWIMEHPELEGVYNCCSPNPVTNQTFMQELRKATGYIFGLPAFTWMLKLGAPLIGTETELVLKSRRVLPAKISATGFQFQYPEISQAFAEIIQQVPRKQYHLF